MNKIKEKRLSKNITQTELAEELGLTQGIMSMSRENRLAYISLFTLAYFCLYPFGYEQFLFSSVGRKVC